MDNLIIIEGGNYREVRQALEQWIQLYSPPVRADYQFRLYDLANETRVIETDVRLENEYFFFLVNYLAYPEGIDYKVTVTGFTRGKDQVILKGQDLVVYLAPGDTDGDNVYVVTSGNKSYKVDFGGKVREVQGFRNYSVIPEMELNDPEVVQVSQFSEVKKEQHREKNVESSEPDIAKRFRIFFTIILSAFFLNILVFYMFKNPSLYLTALGWIGKGTALWFLIDYKMLRVKELYMRCLGIAGSLLLYGIILASKVEFVKISDTWALFPLTLLLVHYPLRMLFVRIFEREPEITRSDTYPDAIYTVLLVIATLIAVFFISNILETFLPYGS